MFEIEERIQGLDEDLDFAVSARLAFESGDEKKRREIILRLGSNFILLNHTLDIVLKEPLERVVEIAPLINAAVEKFEPLKNIDNSRQLNDYLSTSIEMGRVRDNTTTLRLILTNKHQEYQVHSILFENEQI